MVAYLILHQEMEKAQAKGELNEEDLRALEMDVTGKVSTHILKHGAHTEIANR
jgi:hypothetical protein